MMNVNTYSYHRLGLLLGALGLVVVACSDDDDAAGPGDTAGTGGSSAGTSGAGSSSGGSSAGKPNGGSSNGGSSNGGTSSAGNSNGGKAGSSTAGSGAGGEAGGEAMGGQGMAGEAMGGAGGGAEGGAGGAGDVTPIVPDTLDNGDFSAYDAGWTEEGDVDASTFKWHDDTSKDPCINPYSANAYKVATVQKVDPLPNGTYTFSMDVERAANLNEQYIFARGCKAGEPDGIQKMVTDAAGSSGYTKITLNNIEVTAGSCTVGIYTDAPAGGWANIDNAVFGLQAQ